MKKALRVSFWVFVILVAFLTVQVVRTGRSSPGLPEISYSDFLTRVANGQVRKVTITCNLIQAYDSKDSSFMVNVPSSQAAMLELLHQHGVEIWVRDAQTWPTWILYLIPVGFLVALWLVTIRQGRRIRRLESGSSSPLV